MRAIVLAILACMLAACRMAMWKCSQFQNFLDQIHFQVITGVDFENITEETVIRTERPSPSSSSVLMESTPPVPLYSTPTQRIASVSTRIPTTTVPTIPERILDTSTPHHYDGILVFKPSESGLGNNLYGLASAFLVAAMTNRQLMTSRGYAYHIAFTVHDYWNKTVATAPNNVRIPMGNQFVGYNSCFSEKSKIVQSLLRDSVSLLFRKSNMLLSTNCPLFAFIVQNPKNHQRLIDLGFFTQEDLKPSQANQNAFSLYSRFLRQYVAPTAMIQSEVHRRLANARHSTLLCMHIRCGNPLADFQDQASFLGLRDISTFQACRKRLLRGNATTLITSDSTRAKTMIRNYCPGSDVIWFEDPAVHTMTRHTRRTKESVVLSVATDLFTLATCDQFIGTYRSSFSVAAGAMIGRMPVLVTPRERRCEVPKTLRFG